MNKNENKEVTIAQRKALLEYFKSGKRITALKALNDLGIYNFSARLFEVEVMINRKVNRKSVIVINRFNQAVRVNEYWVDEYVRANHLKEVIGNQPIMRILNPKAWDKATEAQKELDEIEKNNPDLFGDKK